MNNSLMQILNSTQIETIVTTREVLEKYIPNFHNVESFVDMRSASFYALGRVIAKGEKIAVVTDDDGLASCLTAFTEAKYQGVTLSLIGINIDKENDFMRLQMNDELWVSSDNGSSSSALDQWGHEEGTKALYVNLDQSVSKKNNKDKFLENLVQQLQQEFVVSYRGDTRYGRISEYIGMSYRENRPSVLVMNELQLRSEINAFNSRYINNNFKIVVIGSGQDELNNFSWIENNNIHVTVLQAETLQYQDIASCLNSDSAEFVYIINEVQNVQ